MTYPVTVSPSQTRFDCEEKESLLHAALRAGINVDHGCTNGGCGRCKVRLASGEIERIRNHDFVLTEAERAAGDILMCCHSARSELELEATIAHDGSDIPLQTIETKVRKLETIDANTLRLTLRTPRAKTLRFMAGQHARLKLNENLQRELPIASCPCDGLNLEFHLHRDASDPLSDYLFERAKKNMPIEIEAPCGNFTLVENDPAPLLFIAWGTGFAPIHSLIENCLSLELSQNMDFHWVVHEHENHYANGYCRSVADAIDNFRYYAIRTDTAAEAIEQILAHYDSMSDWRSYIAAPPAIIDTVSENLIAHDLPADMIKSDAIVA